MSQETCIHILTEVTIGTCLSFLLLETIYTHKIEGTL
jgi:hypothetical protein